MTSNPFESTSAQIAASILSADFAKLKAEIDQVDRGGADFLHLDIMDGHFVPNISFGPAVTAASRRSTSAFLDAHLMISEPIRYAPAFIKAGADALTFQVEVVNDPAATAQELRKLGCRHVGITLNPATPVERILPALDSVDVVLVMSVVPGFSGQKFMPEVLDKVRTVRRLVDTGHLTVLVEIDGGINDETIEQAAEAGVD